jgi:sulfite reductase (NADPH) flavoprotein alpha-component
MDVQNKEFAERLQALISQVVKEKGPQASSKERLWLEGYAQGVADTVRQLSFPTANAAVVASKSGQATILFASHSGNGKSLARRFLSALESDGLNARMIDMAVYKPKDLKSEKNLLVIISTHGEGVPPVSAEGMFEFLQSSRAPKLEGLGYSVLALGDKSYVHFCKAGADLDEKLASLGAKRLTSRVDCDVDFEEQAQTWLRNVSAELKKSLGLHISHTGITSKEMFQDAPPAYSVKRPFKSVVLSKINLNGQGSEKETYHIELSIEGSGLSYQPGDACGLLAQNSDVLVNDVLKALDFTGAEPTGQADTRTLSQALKGFELTVITPEVIKRHNSFAQSSRLTDVLADAGRLREFMYGRDILDLIREYPVAYTAQDFISLLREIPARLYSIASSPLETPDEVHLLVSAVRYHAFGRNKEGVASTYWADRIQENETVPVYVKSNEAFRLPSDGQVPLIMVGPGSGVAPFRAFVLERAAAGHTGKNWLFFGNPFFTVDFFYQTEWQEHLKNGILNRMDVAFSRDQNEKVYVQQRIIEQGKNIYAWINEGAFIYVCGDTRRMAPDVFNAFVAVVEAQGELNHEKAVDLVKGLKRSGRYLEDVY